MEDGTTGESSTGSALVSFSAILLFTSLSPDSWSAGGQSVNVFFFLALKMISFTK